MARIRIMLVACVALLAFAALGATGAGAKGGTGETKYSAFLTGKAETPKGDPDGHARVTITVEAAQGKVCYDIRKTKLETTQAAHIHKGKAGVSGPVVVPLIQKPTGAGKGKITGCVTTGFTKAVLAAIKANPAGYYVNIHTKKYPGGAVRGQLAVTHA